jgi:hypothetical protein
MEIFGKVNFKQNDKNLLYNFTRIVQSYISIKFNH